jgi:hypothetical protein
MSNYCFVAPILPGGVDKMKTWIRDEVNNSADHDRLMRQAGVSREQIWIQHTPMGDFAVASWETSDPGSTFQVLTNSNDPWAAKFRAFLSSAHGIDFSKAMHLNEQIADWHAMEKIRS